MVIQLSEPETKSMDENNQNKPNHISYLSNTQQDELMRKYILQERSFTLRLDVVNAQTGHVNLVKFCRITNPMQLIWRINACFRT